MSAEVVVKKRGRPKKVIPDLVEVKVPEPKVASRAKSTKAAPKSTKTTSTAFAKPIATKKSAIKPIAASAEPKTTPKASASPKPVLKAASPQPKPVAPEEMPMVRAEAPPSKILRQVRELEAKRTSFGQEAQPTVPAPAADSKSVPTTKSTSLPPSSSPATSTKSPNTVEAKASNSKPVSPNPAATPPPPPKPASKPHIPLAALNSDIVSNISARAGARPNNGGNNPLPKNYKSVSNRVTMVLVALPIAICTSYVLWQRLVMGEEKKQLVPVVPNELPNAEAKPAEPSAGVPSS